MSKREYRTRALKRAYAQMGDNALRECIEAHRSWETMGAVLRAN